MNTMDEFRQLDTLLQEIDIYGGYCRASGEQEALGNMGISAIHTEWAKEVYQRIAKQVAALREIESMYQADN
jgi:hypothetical protein